MGVTAVDKHSFRELKSQGEEFKTGIYWGEAWGGGKEGDAEEEREEDWCSHIMNMLNLKYLWEN